MLLGCGALGTRSPGPIALGLLAELLSFVPYVGSILSGVPPFLITYARSPMAAIYVVGLYLAIHGKRCLVATF
jgi:predicted PurR-regulated permease PerM